MLYEQPMYKGRPENALDHKAEGKSWTTTTSLPLNTRFGAPSTQTTRNRGLRGRVEVSNTLRQREILYFRSLLGQTDCKKWWADHSRLFARCLQVEAAGCAITLEEFGTGMDWDTRLPQRAVVHLEQPRIQLRTARGRQEGHASGDEGV
eukprot:2555007-Rhodomonas_salina.1